MTQPRNTQRSRLQAIFKATGPETKTLTGILQRQEALYIELKTIPNKRGLLPFLKAYILIIKALQADQVASPSLFQDPNAFERLNAYFAVHYFRRMEDFVMGGKGITPWGRYFAYCARPNTSAFVQLLLGVNAHINGDLANGLVDASYQNYEDYLAMNTLLQKRVPSIMQALVFDAHDPVALGGLVFHTFMRQEFSHVIAGWRADAWDAAEALRSGRLTKLELWDETERVGKRLTEIFTELFALKRISKNLAEIHTLRIKI